MSREAGEGWVFDHAVSPCDMLVCKTQATGEQEEEPQHCVMSSAVPLPALTESHRVFIEAKAFAAEPASHCAVKMAGLGQPVACDVAT